MSSRARDGHTTSRRTFVTGGAAAIGGLATMLVSGTATEAHIGAPPLHGDSDTEEPAVSGNNNDGGPGVFGSSVGGAGVVGRHDGDAVGPGVIGLNNGRGPGVVGISTSNDPGVLGRAAGQNVAVRGEATDGAGVLGLHASATVIGPAVVGLNTGAGAGLQGIAPGEHPAVIAQSGSVPAEGGPFTADCGAALVAIGRTHLRLPTESDGLPIGSTCSGFTLHVDGPVVIAGPLFMHVGNGTIAAGARDALVAAEVSTSSHVSVTLVGDPTRGNAEPAAVSWVERMPGAFRVHLNRRVDQATPFTFTTVGPS